MCFKRLLVMVLFGCLPLAAFATETQPTIGGDISKVEEFMQTTGAVAVAVVGDPRLLHAIGLVGIQVNDQVEITNLGHNRFRLVDLRQGRQIVSGCSIWQVLRG